MSKNSIDYSVLFIGELIKYIMDLYNLGGSMYIEFDGLETMTENGFLHRALKTGYIMQVICTTNKTREIKLTDLGVWKVNQVVSAFRSN